MEIFKRENEGNSLMVINFARLLFLGFIIFEVLNVLKIVQFNTQFTWLGLVITSTFVLMLLEIVAYKYKRTKGEYLHWSIWIVVVAALSIDAFGDFFFLYSRVTWWDQFGHYFISAVACLVIFISINAFWIDQFKFSLLFREGRLKLALLLASASTMSLGAIYEVEEYIEDALFHTNRLGPGVDTANDLFLDFLGVATVGLIILFYHFVIRKNKIFEK